MTTVTIPDFLPQLYVGAHKADTGRACIMNAVAYMSGAKQINDMPDCVWPPFAKIAQVINDHLCPHLTTVITGDIVEVDGEAFHTEAQKLCDACSHDVWMMGATLIGTGEVARKLSSQDQWRLRVRVAYRLVNWDTVSDYVQPAERRILNSILFHAANVMGVRQAPPYRFTPGELSTLRNVPECSKALRSFVTFAYILADIHESGEVYLGSIASMFSNSSRLVSDLGQRSGAHQMMRFMPTFIDWLHQAAGRQAPQQYTVTADEVAKVPVMAG